MAKPGGTGPIGPFPPRSRTPTRPATTYDRLRRRVLWTMPSGLYVVGSTDGGERRNGMTLNWATQVSFEPKLVGIGVEKEALHPRADRRRRGVQRSASSTARTAPSCASSPSPSRSTSTRRTLNGFPYHDGVTGAPILTQAVAYLDCEVRQAVDVGGHTLFIGEVVDAGFHKAEDTPVLRMEDTRMSYGG